MTAPMEWDNKTLFVFKTDQYRNCNPIVKNQWDGETTLDLTEDTDDDQVTGSGDAVAPNDDDVDDDCIVIERTGGPVGKFVARKIPREVTYALVRFSMGSHPTQGRTLLYTLNRSQVGIVKMEGKAFTMSFTLMPNMAWETARGVPTMLLQKTMVYACKDHATEVEACSSWLKHLMTKELRRKETYIHHGWPERFVSETLLPWDWHWERTIEKEGIKQRLVANWDGWLLSEEKITSVDKHTMGGDVYVVDAWVARMYELRPRACTSLDRKGLGAVLRTLESGGKWECQNWGLLETLAMASHPRLGADCKLFQMLGDDGLAMVLHAAYMHMLTNTCEGMVTKILKNTYYPHAQ